EEMWAQGQAMTLDEALDHAMEKANRPRACPPKRQRGSLELADEEERRACVRRSKGPSSPETARPEKGRAVPRVILRVCRSSRLFAGTTRLTIATSPRTYTRRFAALRSVRMSARTAGSRGASSKGLVGS